MLGVWVAFSKYSSNDRVDRQNGVEGNPLAITYSVLVSFWSVYFLSMWRRRQNELMFLWGTDGYERGEHAREEAIREPARAAVA